MKTPILLVICSSLSMGLFAQNDTAPKKIQGKFESKKGVMHSISCHCYNVGYLTTNSGDKIIVCFDNLPNSSDLEINCKKIEVEGESKSHTSGGDGGPCPEDTATIFYVKKWKCKK